MEMKDWEKRFSGQFGKAMVEAAIEKLIALTEKQNELKIMEDWKKYK